MKPKSLLPELPVSANSGREDEVFSDGIERAKDDSASIVETQNCNGSIESRYDNDILDFRFDSKDNEEKGRRDDADRLSNDTYEAPEKNVELSNDADLFFKNYDTNGSIGGSKLLPGIKLNIEAQDSNSADFFLNDYMDGNIVRSKLGSSDIKKDIHVNAHGGNDSTRNDENGLVDKQLIESNGKLAAESEAEHDASVTIPIDKDSLNNGRGLFSIFTGGPCGNMIPTTKSFFS